MEKIVTTKETHGADFKTCQWDEVKEKIKSSIKEKIDQTVSVDETKILLACIADSLFE